MGYSRCASLLGAVDDRYLSTEKRRRKRLLLALHRYFEGDNDDKSASALEKLTVGKEGEITLESGCRLFDLLMKQKKPAEAARQYDKLPSGYSDTRFLLSIDFRAGALLFDQKQFELAAKAYGRYIEMNRRRRQLASPPPSESGVGGDQKPAVDLDCSSPLVTGSFIERARCAAALGKEKEAIKLLDQVISKCTSSPLVYRACYLLGEYRAKAGNTDEAIELLKRCEKINEYEEIWKDAQSLLLADIEVKKRLLDISKWWLDEPE